MPCGHRRHARGGLAQTRGPWRPRRGRGGCGSRYARRALCGVLCLQPIGLCFILCEVGFDLVTVGMIVRQRGVDLREREVLDLVADLLRCMAELVPDCNTLPRYTCTGNYWSATPELV